MLVNAKRNFWFKWKRFERKICVCDVVCERERKSKKFSRNDTNFFYFNYIINKTYYIISRKL